jgi:hypothetical protein
MAKNKLIYADWEKDTWDYKWEEDEEEYISQEQAKFLKEWEDIVIASNSNVTLKRAIEQVKIIYYLSKQDNNTVQHHSV